MTTLKACGEGVEPGFDSSTTEHVGWLSSLGLIPVRRRSDMVSTSCIHNDDIIYHFIISVLGSGDAP